MHYLGRHYLPYDMQSRPCPSVTKPNCRSMDELIRWVAFGEAFSDTVIVVTYIQTLIFSVLQMPLSISSEIEITKYNDVFASSDVNDILQFA